MKRLSLPIAVLLLALISIYAWYLRKELKHYEDAASSISQGEISDPCEVKIASLESQFKAARAIAEENERRAKANEEEAFRNKAKAEQDRLRAQEAERHAMNAQKEASRMMQLAIQNEKMAYEKVRQLELLLKEKN